MNTVSFHALSARERAEVEHANAMPARPVVFIHGLWLLASSWAAWRHHFEAAGYVTLAPGWPDEPVDVAQARRQPELLAGKHLGAVAEHLVDVIEQLDEMPIVIGHSFGGLLAQKIAGLGLARCTVAIDPAPFRGVLPLPLSSIRGAWPVLGRPSNWGRAVALSFEQFRYGFANAIPEDEARELYDAYHVAAPGAPLFQAATANLDPWTEASVDTMNPERGPLLIVSGQHDHLVTHSMAQAAWKRQRRNPCPTELVEMAGRGHSLIIDSGWREVADVALEFVLVHDSAMPVGPRAWPPTAPRPSI